MMKRVYIAFLLALSLIFSLTFTGCGADTQTGSSSDKENNNTASPSNSSASDAEQAEAETTEQTEPEPAPVDFTGIAPAPESDFFYSLDESTGEAHIMQYLGNDNVVVVPNTIEGLTVVSVCFGQEKDVEGVKIPEGVKWISEKCFFRYRYLRTVILPSTLESIGFRAFYQTRALKTIDLPEGLQQIEADAFYESVLEYVVVPSTVTAIGGEAFAANIKELTILDGDTPLELTSYKPLYGNGIYHIPARVTVIEDPFGSDECMFSTKSTIICPAGSVTEAYAKRFGLNYQTTT